MPCVLLIIGATLAKADSGPLDIDTEITAIKNQVKLQATPGNPLNLKDAIVAPYPVCNFSTLKQKLQEERPGILHISGHGTSKEMVFVADHDSSRTTTVSTSSFVDAVLLATPQLVVLNNCYSEQTAKMLQQRGVRFVIGTAETVPDKEAIAFSRDLYSALSQGQTLLAAYDRACTQSHQNLNFIYRRYPAAEEQWKITLEELLG